MFKIIFPGRTAQIFDFDKEKQLIIHKDGAVYPLHPSLVIDEDYTIADMDDVMPGAHWHLKPEGSNDYLSVAYAETEDSIVGERLLQDDDRLMMCITESIVTKVYHNFVFAPESLTDTTKSHFKGIHRATGEEYKLIIGLDTITGIDVNKCKPSLRTMTALFIMKDNKLISTVHDREIGMILTYFRVERA